MLGPRALIRPGRGSAPVGPASTFDLSDRETVGDTGTRADGGTVIGGGWIGYLAYPDTPKSGATAALLSFTGGPLSVPEKIENDGLKPRQSGINDGSRSMLWRLLVEEFG